MRKVRLELDSLAVESFVPDEARKGRGTVRAYVSLYWEDCSPSDTCPGAWPCDPTDQSCAGSCFQYSCHPTCPGGGGGGGSHFGAACSDTCNDGG